jgi:uncharacterized protein
MNHRLLWMLLAIGVFGCSIGSEPLGAAGIPEAKPLGWVADVAGLLSAEDVAELERLGETVFSQDRADLVVLTVDSTRGAEPRSLATATFNRWRLGDPERKNGILIFVAIGDRAAEIVLGNGIDGAAEVAKSDRIMQEVMVPRFRAGQPAAAVVAGARACALEFFGVGSLPVEAPPAPTPAPPERLGGIGEQRRPGPILLLATLALILPLGIAGWLKMLSHRCKQCRKKMTRLAEADDDQYLEPGERVEERVRSVDYEVWACLDCGEVVKLRNYNFRRAHHPCRQCKSITALRRREVERRATATSTGLMKVHDRCEHCGHEDHSTWMIPATPALHAASSSRSRSSDSGPFGSWGSGGGSSSSGGGGSSSGRGSSGRW